MHGEFAEVDGAATEAEEVTPLLNTLDIFLRVAIHLFQIRIHDVNLSELASDMRRRQQGLGVKENIVAGDLNSRYAFRVKKIGQLDVECTEETFEGDLEQVQFCYPDLDAIVPKCADGADELYWKRNDFMECAT